VFDSIGPAALLAVDAAQVDLAGEELGRRFEKAVGLRVEFLSRDSLFCVELVADMRLGTASPSGSSISLVFFPSA
jgi:hypothetical protein